MGAESVRRQRIVASHVYAVSVYFLPSEQCTLHSLVVRLTLPQALFATSSAYTDNTARPSFDCRPCRYITGRCESPYRHRFTGRLQTDGRATAAHQLHCLHHHKVVKVMWYMAASPSRIVQSYPPAGDNVHPVWYMVKVGRARVFLQNDISIDRFIRFRMLTGVPNPHVDIQTTAQMRDFGSNRVRVWDACDAA